MGWDEGGGWGRWLSWRGLLLAGGGLAVSAALAFVWLQGSAPTASDTAAAEGAVAIGRHGAVPDPAANPGRRYVLVYVSGAVASPGLYRLASGLRVADAIAAAGGLRDDADLDRMPNLAGRLTDREQVKVPVTASP